MAGETEQVTQDSGLIGGGGATSLNITQRVDADSEIDDLIPDDLKAAYAKIAAEETPKEDPKKEEKVKAAEDDSTEPEEKPKATEDISDELISSDSISKLLSGEDEEKKTDEGEKKEEFPWSENQIYKDLLSALSNAGLKKQQVDSFLQEVVDKHIVDKSKIVNGLESKLEEKDAQEKLLTAELARLREIEKGVKFDSLEDVKTKYHAPRAEIASNIRRLLDLESIDIPASKLLAAKNMAEFTDLIKDVQFDDDSVLTNLKNYWRAHKTLDHDYEKERKEAAENVTKNLNATLTKDSLNSVFKTALSDMMKSSEKYKYINEAIQKGLDKDEKVAGVIRGAKKNVESIFKALSDPGTYANDRGWLKSLTSFIIDASHKSHIEDQYTELSTKYADQTKDLKRLYAAYKELRESARGIQGSKGMAGSKSNGHKSTSVEPDKDAEKLVKFINNKLDIDDLIPGL